MMASAFLLGALAYGLAACRVTRPLLWDHFHDHVFWRGPSSERRRFALSFDDGPHPENTPRLLALLALHQVRATFFLVGRNARQHPALVQSLVDGGHEIGVHSHNHRILPLLGGRKLEQELDRGAQDISSAGGGEPTLFRPPYGLRDPRVLRASAQRGWSCVLWSVMPGDWMRPPAWWLVAWMRLRVRGGAIVLLHDGGGDRRPTLEALAQTLPLWRNQGLLPVPCGELLGLCAAQQKGAS